MSGSDSSAGTSAGAAWRTIGKALGASGISSGDTVYIGAGQYGESVTIGVTSPGAETKVIGDIDGSKTGDAGEVWWTGYTVSENAVPTTSALLITSSKNNFTFQDINFLGTATSSPTVVSSVTSYTWKFTRCLFHSIGANSLYAISATAAANTAYAWTIENCIFSGTPFSGGCLFTPVRPSGADFNINLTIRNCLFLTTWVCVSFALSGANSFGPGGATITNCTVPFGGSTVFTVATNYSTTIPVVVKNCIIVTGGTALNAASSGQLTEDYNYISAVTARTNVTAGVHSRDSTTAKFPAAIFDVGNSFLRFGPSGSKIIGSSIRGFGLSYFGSDTSAAPSTDVLSRIRDSSGYLYGDNGTATSGATTSITQTGKTWGVNQWKDWLVRITSGTGSGQVKRISSNTATALTTSGAAPAGGLWATTPASGSVYTIYKGTPTETGKATSGSTTTIVDSGANWATNCWAGYVASFTGGSGSGQAPVVTSNTATTLTFAAQGSAASSTTTYSLYLATGIDQVFQPVGFSAVHDAALRETSVTDAGSVGIRIEGTGNHEFLVPVDAAATTISIKARYDANHGTTNKPQAILVVNDEIGVATETKTMTSAADTWETLTFTQFTPTAKGVVAIQLVSRSGTPYGRAYFDTFAVA